MKLFVAQLGARMHYAIPRMLQDAEMLEHFYTDICATKGWPRLLNMIPAAHRSASVRRLLGRVPIGVPNKSITAFTAFGLEYYRRRNRPSVTSKKSTALWAGEEFCRLVLKQSVGDSNGVYTFNSAGLELLKRAHTQGLPAVMEQTIAPFRFERQLLSEEQERFPEWQLPAPDDECANAFIDREAAEWDSADLILCGSEFVRDGISACGGPASKCRIVPYGVEISNFAVPTCPRREGPLRVLTVGAIGLRKGSPYVLDAAKQLKKKAKFRMVGAVSASGDISKKINEHAELLGPVPRSEMLEHFTWADVFLLPSLCEGSATVTYEALAAGLPVICTSSTGSIVRDRIDGFIVPTCDADGIIEKLTFLADQPDQLQQMKSAARSRSAEDIGLRGYQKRLVRTIQSFYGTNGDEKNIALCD